MQKKRKAPPVTTGYDPRAVERTPKFADGHLPEGKDIPRSPVGADAHIGPQKAPLCKGGCHGNAVTGGLSPCPDDISSSPKAPDGISGDWQ